MKELIVRAFFVTLVAAVAFAGVDSPVGSSAAQVARIARSPRSVGQDAERPSAPREAQRAKEALAAAAPALSPQAEERREKVRAVGTKLLGEPKAGGDSPSRPAHAARASAVVEGLGAAAAAMRTAVDSPEQGDDQLLKSARSVENWLDQTVGIVRQDEARIAAIPAADPASRASKSQSLAALAERRRAVESGAAGFSKLLRAGKLDRATASKQLDGLLSSHHLLANAHGILSHGNPAQVNNSGSGDMPVFSGMAPPLPPAGAVLSGTYQPDMPALGFSDCADAPADPLCSFAPGFEVSSLLHAKIVELGSDPGRIYDYVRNEIAFEAYVGANKSPEATLRTRIGGVQDQCALLTTMLRGAGVPAQYAFGWVYMPIDQIQSWLGQKGFQQTATLTQFRFPYEPRYADGGGLIGYYLYLSWVEAYVPYAGRRGDASERAWVPLMPYVTRTTLSEGQPGAHAATPFDEAGFLTAIRADTADEFYASALAAAAAGPGSTYGVLDIPVKRTEIDERLGVLPATLPVEIVASDTIARSAEIPTPYLLKARVKISGSPSIDTTLSMPEHGLRRLTLSWEAATAFDQSVINSHGGLASTPLFSVSLKPVLRSEGVALGTGASMSYGAQFNIQMSFQQFEDPMSPSTTGFFSVFDKDRQTGTMFALGFDGMQFSDSFLADREAQLVATAAGYAGGFPQDHVEALTGELLYAAGAKYLIDNDKAVQRAAKLYQFQHIRFPQHQTTECDAEAYYLFDRPYLVTPIGAVLDAWALSAGDIHEDLDDTKKSELERVQAYASSALEHQLWEHIIYMEAVSTTKLLQRATVIGMPVYDYAPGNCGTISSDLSLPLSVESAIISACLGGARVVTHKFNQTINQWTGAGWFEHRPDGFGMLISGGLNAGQQQVDGSGGASELLLGVSPEIAKKLASAVAGATGPSNNGGAGTGNPPGSAGGGGPNGSGDSPGNHADPVNLWSGNFYHTEKDVLIPSVGYPLELVRQYNSGVDYDGPMGQRWTHNFNTLVLPTGNPGELRYFDENGGTQLYTEDPPSSGVYKGPAGFTSTITHLGSTLVHRDKRGFTRTHDDTTGKLLVMADRNGNSRTLSYVGDNLDKVADDFGASLTFTYTPSDRVATVKDHTNRIWSFTYNAAGDLLSASAPSDLVTVPSTRTYTYDAQHRMVTMTSPTGGVRTIDYYADGKAHRQVFPDGRKFTYIYDLPFKNETEVLYPDGFSSVLYTFNDTGDPIKKIAQDEAVSTYSYDVDRNVVSATDPLGHTTTWTWDANNNATTETSPLGNMSSITWDPTFSLPTILADDLGVRGTLTYDANGNIATFTDAAGEEYLFTINARGQITSVTDPDGEVVTNQYDAQGRLVQRTDKLGNSLQLGYDSLNRVVSQTLADLTEVTIAWDARDQLLSVHEGAAQLSANTWDASGNCVSRTNELGHTNTSTYDGNNDLVSVTTSDGAVMSLVYTSLKKVAAGIDASGPVGVLEYDARGRLTGTTDPEGRFTELVRDAAGRVVAHIDPLGRTTQFKYDADDQLIEKVYPDGTVEVFEHNAGHLLTARIDRDGGVTAWEYDSRRNVETLTDPNGGAHTYEYDAVNRLTQVTDALGNSTVATYDANGNLATVENPNGFLSTFAYNVLNQRISRTVEDSGGAVVDAVLSGMDWKGDLLSIADSDTSATFTYDDASRLIAASTASTAVQPASAMGYGYDPRNNRTSMTDPLGDTVSYDYNLANQLVGITDQLDGATTFQYDARRLLSGIRYANDATVGFVRDAASQLTALLHKRGTADIASIEIERDLTGNVTQRTRSNATDTYGYNPVGRVTNADHTDGPSENWTYDLNGNWTSSHLSGSYAYDAANRLLSDGTFSYQYDDAGNRTKKTRILTPLNFTEYEYDYDNRLTSVTTVVGGAPQSTVEHAYDGLGRRVQKNVNGVITRYVYDEWQLSAEYNGANQLVTRYVYAKGINGPISMIKNGTAYFYHHDHVGSVVAITDGAGNVVQKYKYDTFGQRTFVQDPAFVQPFGFHGHVHDESGIVQMRRRDYDPEAGRFLQVDPTGMAGGFNLYAFANNNPLRIVDLMGTDWWDWISTPLGIIGSALGIWGAIGLVMGGGGALLIGIGLALLFLSVYALTVALIGLFVDNYSTGSFFGDVASLASGGDKWWIFGAQVLDLIIDLATMNLGKGAAKSRNMWGRILDALEIIGDWASRLASWGDTGKKGYENVMGS